MVLTVVYFHFLKIIYSALFEKMFQKLMSQKQILDNIWKIPLVLIEINIKWDEGLENMKLHWHKKNLCHIFKFFKLKSLQKNTLLGFYNEKGKTKSFLYIFFKLAPITFYT